MGFGADHGAAAEDPPEQMPHPAVLIAAAFHETYERLAPRHGYLTRDVSRVPWADVPPNNKDLMVATVAALLHLDVIRQGENRP
jgi:hypothetical protein